VGWIDDHKDIAAGWRGILYLLASIIALVYIGGLEQIKFGGLFIHLNLAGSILAVIGLTWLTNLYNFMDGTDAIASVQAITTGSFAGILFFINNQVGLAIICFVIIMSCVGFLTWNWPPAKIFMGDVGSCMIGYTFGVMAIIGEVTNTVYIYIWIILLAVFIWDATFTLVKRIIYGEKWYVAHRTHAYQRLIQLGISHSTLAIYLILLNICVLWPIAYIAYRWVYLSVYMMLLSIIIVLSLWSIIQYIYYKSENQVINGNPSDG
jgi:Fuc2NAc and GlcNAc transferase